MSSVKRKSNISPLKEGVCPKCLTALNFSEEDRVEGVKITCPKCGEKFLITEAKKSIKRGSCLKTGLYIFIALLALSILITYPWFTLGVLGGWLVYKFYKPSEEKKRWKVSLIVGIVFLGLILNINWSDIDSNSDSSLSQFTKKEEIEEKKLEAMELFKEAKTKLEEEDAQGAFYLLDEAIKIYPGGSFNQAVFMKEDLSKAETEEFIKESLGGLTDEEFNLLVSENLSKEFLKDEVVNRYFLKVLQKNKDKRNEYYTEIQGKRIAEEMVRAEEERLRAEKERTEKISYHFSAWDGSHIELKNYIKRNMNDPSSFQHVETLYSDKGDYLVVQMTFRGKNAFGGLVLNSVTANILVDDPSMIEIIKTSY